jgi:hypothetical protein
VVTNPESHKDGTPRNPELVCTVKRLFLKSNRIIYSLRVCYWIFSSFPEPQGGMDFVIPRNNLKEVRLCIPTLEQSRPLLFYCTSLYFSPIGRGMREIPVSVVAEIYRRKGHCIFKKRYFTDRKSLELEFK